MGWLKAIAPTIATVLGGPFAGMAVSIIADKLGVKDATQENIKDMLTAGNLTGDQLVAIKQAELALKVRLEELKIRPEEIAAADRASARYMQAQVKSEIPGFLAILITIGFFGILIGMMMGYLQATGNTEALLIMLGALGAAWGAVVNFYYGSSAGSEAKNSLLASKNEK